MAEVTLTYHEEADGMHYPDLTAPEEAVSMRSLGRFAVRVAEYLRENHSGRYRTLVRFGKLTGKMQEVENEANRMMEELEKSYLKNNPPGDRTSTMEMWQIRQQARMQAEEIVMNEIVMKFH